MITVVGICGVGFVGSTLAKVFSDKGVTTILYDKYTDTGSMNDLLKVKAIFLCLPTKYLCKEGCYDKRAVHEVCKYLSTNNYDGLVVLKSTIEPLTTESLSVQYNLQIVHNPEFLTSGSPVSDFMNQKHIVIGTVNSTADKKTSQLIDFYNYHFPNAKVSICLAKESECMKIMENSFAACKVQIFNEFYLLTKKMGIDYEMVKTLMLKNSRIAPYHCTVPGRDGQLSYGGACFPKDICALNAVMKKENTKHKVLDAVIEERNKMRNNSINIV